MEVPPIRELVDLPEVWERMGRVETRLFEASVATDNPFLTEISQHLLAAGGKRLRPLLAQIGALLGPDRDHGPIEAGVAVELVHAGSLYHDDVIDEGDTRHGVPSANVNWSNTVAILAGDFLLARASEVAAPLGEEAVALVARTYATLCEGQALELQLADDITHGPDDYLRVIAGKTASLIRTSARLGAMTAGADADAVEAISEWAFETGLVFQMTDDVLDLVATEEYLGKPAGSDIDEGVFTLPVLYALANDEELRAVLTTGHPYTDDARRFVVNRVVEGGHVDTVLDEATERLRRAEKASQRLGSVEVRDLLTRFDRYLMTRVEAARER
ncbi:MAG: polyprenyl synthetase family protein [Acidimicrobiia bacterium]|nr:polyprenyl synthetase family protein [Acidimicrobiia bacterium]